MLPDVLIEKIMWLNADEFNKITFLSKRYHKKYAKKIKRIKRDDQLIMRDLIKRGKAHTHRNSKGLLEDIFFIPDSKREWSALRRWYMKQGNTREEFEKKKRNGESNLYWRMCIDKVFLRF